MSATAHTHTHNKRQSATKKPANKQTGYRLPSVLNTTSKIVFAPTFGSPELRGTSKSNVVNVRGKYKRQGRTEGYTSKFKKAYVKLTNDSKAIEFFESLA